MIIGVLLLLVCGMRMHAAMMHYIMTDDTIDGCMHLPVAELYWNDAEWVIFSWRVFVVVLLFFVACLYILYMHIVYHIVVIC